LNKAIYCASKDIRRDMKKVDASALIAGAAGRPRSGTENLL
jgi:hypothetical protein